MKLQLSIVALLSCLATACVDTSDDAAPPPPTEPAFKGDCVVNGCDAGLTCIPSTGLCYDPNPTVCSTCSCTTCQPGEHCDYVVSPPGSVPSNYPACFPGCTSHANCTPPSVCVQLTPPAPGTCEVLTES